MSVPWYVAAISVLYLFDASVIPLSSIRPGFGFLTALYVCSAAELTLLSTYAKKYLKRKYR